MQKAFDKAKIIISLLDPTDDDWAKFIELFDTFDGNNMLIFNINTKGKSLFLNVDKKISFNFLKELENIKSVSSIKIYNKFLKDYIETLINIEAEINEAEIYDLVDE